MKLKEDIDIIITLSSDEFTGNTFDYHLLVASLIEDLVEDLSVIVTQRKWPKGIKLSIRVAKKDDFK
jgi:hypothetical protein